MLKSGPPEFNSDYTQVLRTHLLPCPEYCARAKAPTYEGLIGLYKDKLDALLTDALDDDAGRGGGSDRYRCAEAGPYTRTI